MIKYAVFSNGYITYPNPHGHIVNCMYTALRKIQPFDACVHLPDDGIVSNNLSNQAKQEILFDVQLSLQRL